MHQGWWLPSPQLVTPLRNRLLPQISTCAPPLRRHPAPPSTHDFLLPAEKSACQWHVSCFQNFHLPGFTLSIAALLLWMPLTCNQLVPDEPISWPSWNTTQRTNLQKLVTCGSWVSLWPNQFNSNAGNQIFKPWRWKMQICIKCWHHYVGPGWQDEHIHEATWYLIPEHLSPSRLLYIVSPSQLWLASLTGNNNNYTLCVITGAASPRLCFRKIWIVLFRFSIHQVIVLLLFVGLAGILWRRWLLKLCSMTRPVSL